MCNELSDGARTFFLRVVVALKHFHKCPLRPLVIFGVARTHFAVPIVAKSYLLQLLTIARYVFHRGHFRMLTGLDGILLGGQSIGIVAHRMEHIESFQSLVASKNIAGNVAQRMPHMKSGSRGIRKHIEHIIFGFVVIDFTAIRMVVAPPLLPFLFNFAKIIFHSFFVKIF